MVEHLPGYQVVSSHGSTDDALSVLPGATPEIVLLDIRMPGLSGIECARRLKQKMLDLKIIMVTAYLEDALIAEAFRAGAIGYVVKPFAPDVVASALRNAHLGVIHLEGPVSERFSAWMRERRARPLAVLSEREVEVLSLVKRGLSDKEIASRLSVGETTVKSHIRKILGKLKVTSRSGAVSEYFDYF